MKTMNKKGMLVIAAVLLLAAALFVGAGAAEPGIATASAATAANGHVVFALDNPGNTVAVPEDNGGDNGTGISGDITVTTEGQLRSAIANKTDGGTITLGDSFSMSGICVPATANFILDFNKKTLTLRAPGAGSAGTATQGFQLLQGSNVTFKNGTIQVNADNKTYAAGASRIVWLINSYGTLNLVDMTIDGENVNTNMAEGQEDNKFVVHANTGVLNIKGTEITAPKNVGEDYPVYAVGASWYKTAAYTSGAEVTIGQSETTDTEGKHKQSGIDGSIKYRLYNWEGDLPAGTTDMPKLDLTDNTEVTGDLNVSPEAAAVPGVTDKVTVADTAKVEGDSYVAEIETGGVKTQYFTLKDAINAVGDNGTIKLLRDFTSPGITVAADKKFTLDFGGADGAKYTLTLAAPGAGSSGTETQGFQLLQNSDVTFKNGTIQVDPANIDCTAGTSRIVWIINSYGKLTLNNMSIDGENVNQNMVEGEEDNKFVVHANTGEVTITDTTVTAPDVEEPGVKPVYAVGVSWNKDYDNGAKVKIDGNSQVLGDVKYRLYGNWAGAIPTEATNMPVLEVTGSATVDGNLDISPEAAAVPGVTTGGNNIKGADQITGAYVAAIGSTKYLTLADAITAAQPGNTITLLRNCESSGITVAADKKFTLNFDGYILTLKAPAAGSSETETQGFQLLKGSEVTFNDGCIRIDESNTKIASGNRIVWLINSYGTLTINDMTIDGTYVNQNMVAEEEDIKFVIQANTGTVNITGNTSIAAPESVDENPVYALGASWFKTATYTEGSNVTINTTGHIAGPVKFSMYKTPTVPEDLTNGPKLKLKNGIFEGALDVQEALKEYAKTSVGGGIEISGGQFNPNEVDITYLNQCTKPGFRINSNGKVTPVSSGSSSSQGSSVWLTNDTPVEPKVTPTPTPTPGAVETPGVKPVNPTETPAKTPAPFLGILAGLGAAAVVFGLRRK